MAPSRKISVNAMLLKNGYDAAEEEVGTSMTFEGKNYEVIEDEKGNNVWICCEDKELKEEAYDEEEKDDETHVEKNNEVVVEEDLPVVEEKAKPKQRKPRAPAKAKKAAVIPEIVDSESGTEETKPVVAEKKTRKPRAPAKAKKEVLVESSGESDDVAVVEVQVETEEKPKKIRKPRASAKSKKDDEAVEGSSSSTDEDGKKKRKRRDPSKPKRVREKTCHNVFISEKMFELAKTEPDLNGRQRFKRANELWKELDVDVKTKMVEKYKASKLIAAVDATTEEVNNSE